MLAMLILIALLCFGRDIGRTAIINNEKVPIICYLIYLGTSFTAAMTVHSLFG